MAILGHTDLKILDTKKTLKLFEAGSMQKVCRVPTWVLYILKDIYLKRKIKKIYNIKEKEVKKIIIQMNKYVNK